MRGDSGVNETDRRRLQAPPQGLRELAMTMRRSRDAIGWRWRCSRRSAAERTSVPIVRALRDQAPHSYRFHDTSRSRRLPRAPRLLSRALCSFDLYFEVDGVYHIIARFTQVLTLSAGSPGFTKPALSLVAESDPTVEQSPAALSRDLWRHIDNEHSWLTILRVAAIPNTVIPT